MMLVDQFKQLDWDQGKMAHSSKFRVKDVLFTSIFAAGCDELAEFYGSKQAADFGLVDPNKAAQLTDWAQHSREGLARTWDENMGRYLCEDLNQTPVKSHTGAPIETDTLSGFSPLLAGLGDNTQRTQRLLDALNDPTKYNTKFSLPTTANDNPAFELKRYWRGCVWPITNYFMIRSLNKVAAQHKGTPMEKQAEQISQRLTNQLNQLIDKVGFQEYYMPTATIDDQKKIGFGDFSWTAAVFMMNNAQDYRALRSSSID
jgi:hypothetical protein